MSEEKPTSSSTPHEKPRPPPERCFLSGDIIVEPYKHTSEEGKIVFCERTILKSYLYELHRDTQVEPDENPNNGVGVDDVILNRDDGLAIPPTEEERADIKSRRTFHNAVHLDAKNGIDLIVPDMVRELANSKIIKADYASPVVIVVGKESDGKSLSLSRIIERAVFPFKAGICTLMRIRLVLRTSDTPTVPRVYVRRLTNPESANTTTTATTNGVGNDSEEGEIISTNVRNYTGPNRGRKADVKVDYIPLAYLQEAIQERMIEVALASNPEYRNVYDDYLRAASNPLGGKRSRRPPRPPVSTEHEVVVELCGPTYPNMTLIDLPGIVVADETRWNLVENTKKIVEQTINAHKDNCFVCAVVNASQNWDNEAVGLLRDLGCLPSSIAIFTQVDVARPHLLYSNRFPAKMPQEFAFGVRLVANVRDGLLDNSLTPKDFAMIRDFETNLGFGSSGNRGMIACAVEEAIKKGVDQDTAEANGAILRREFGIRCLQTSLRTGFELFLTEVWTQRTLHALRFSFQEREKLIDALGYPYVTFEAEAECAKQREKAEACMHDIGRAQRGLCLQEMQENVCAQAKATLSQAQTIAVHAMQRAFHEQVCVMAHDVARAIHAVEQLATCPVTDTATLDAQVQVQFDAICAAVNGMTELSRSVAREATDAAMSFLRSHQGLVNYERFPKLLDHLDQQLYNLFDQHVCTPLCDAVRHFQDVYLQDRDDLFLLDLMTSLPPPELDSEIDQVAQQWGVDLPETAQQKQQQQQQQWGVRVTRACHELTMRLNNRMLRTLLPLIPSDDRGTKPSPSSETNSSSSSNDDNVSSSSTPSRRNLIEQHLVIDHTVVVEDEDVTKQRVRYFEETGEICRAIVEIVASKRRFEQETDIAGDSEEKRQAQLDRRTMREMRHQRRNGPALKADVNALELAGKASEQAQTKEQLACMQAIVRDGANDIVLNEVVLKTASAGSLELALSLCRQSNAARTLVIDTPELNSVASAFGELLGEASRLEHLVLRNCNLAQPNQRRQQSDQRHEAGGQNDEHGDGDGQVSRTQSTMETMRRFTSTLLTAIQRTTTLKQLTLDNCSFGNSGTTVIEGLLRSNTTLRKVIIKTTSDMFPECDREAILSCARQRVPIDFETRRSWDVSHLIEFMETEQTEKTEQTEEKKKAKKAKKAKKKKKAKEMKAEQTGEAYVGGPASNSAVTSPAKDKGSDDRDGQAPASQEEQQADAIDGAVPPW